MPISYLVDTATAVAVVLANLGGGADDRRADAWTKSESLLLENLQEMRRTRRRLSRNGWGFFNQPASSLSILFIFLYLFTLFINESNGKQFYSC